VLASGSRRELGDGVAGSARTSTSAPCGHHGCLVLEREPLATPANLVTAVRTLGALVLAVLALRAHSETLLLWSLGVYWVGDMLDGSVARVTDSETRSGAMLDILCDRLNSTVFYVGWAVLHPGDAVPIAVFLTQFVVVDAFLSSSFLAWPLRSPNYYDLVDRRVYQLNWSRFAKAINSGALALTLIFTDSFWLPLALVVGVLGVKCWSVVLVSRSAVPPHAGCAVAAAEVASAATVPVQPGAPVAPVAPVTA
jgi:CDP-diacylglycerol--glycerol-3-phosphate 3-phosphatidyltransferase